MLEDNYDPYYIKLHTLVIQTYGLAKLCDMDSTESSRRMTDQLHSYKEMLFEHGL